MFRRGLAGLCLATFTASAPADIDSSAYNAGGTLRSTDDRQRLERQFAAERAAEARRAAEQQAALQQEREAAAAREAARPYPERLTQQRCTTECHPATNYTRQRHTRLAWTLVVKRMVLLNDAPIPASEQPVIIDHLVRTYPAGSEERVVEYGLAVLGLAALAGAGWGGQRLLQRRRRPQAD